MENTIVQATITDIVDFGAFCTVEINGEEYKGLIHISEIADQFVRDAKEFVASGDVVNALVMEVNEGKKQVKLSIKRAA
ncbi:S1 RNA-binding domain-containing protein [[Acholeplasma] multilocale]|uniref:S1 RNA-binding domain-containing protein n=1 Tax=[Acholeplasma] multilocale TaxID=264638 RepID=UPI00040235AC|nr:S1 RNA-binding domain-containing protein [[Acholeplasma] multilocale]